MSKSANAAVEDFIPFEPGPAPPSSGSLTAPPGPQLKVMPQPGAPENTTNSFAPLTVPPGPGADSTAAPTQCHAGPTPPGAPLPAPAITLERDGDRISRIRIECTCGQVIELNCRY